jgi:hypothetical protein
VSAAAQQPQAPAVPAPVVSREPTAVAAPLPPAPAPAPARLEPDAARPAVRLIAPRSARVRRVGVTDVVAGRPDATASTPEPASSTARALQLEPAPEPSAPEPNPVQARSQPAPAPPPPAAQPSEVSLLQQARKLATQQPEAALRLLDQHAQRFPNGLLVPERELLAIEVLRRLGRDAEAERRAQRFETRYPQSLHRRRLERAP